ncbi:SMI1/KNR4 family protein [Tumebacillus flagellatus]|uniref:Knr4/Smi1-like domain-containing protein n=1 Tax=Tumebacillus flagellatus TaxID=1157490 RepID=A0A074LKY0_9BACL|nr:SMI1/KNR4 family protein [Tumebacillus flagellatus]KEO82791.1 hypothetical protein EL26_13665 [Tumebacillus flagellatus]
MADYSHFSRYIVENPTDHKNIQEMKHVLFQISVDEIADNERRLGRSFPEQLREFYHKIGYGFLCQLDSTRFNRIMDPYSVVDFMLGEDIYEFDEDRELYDLDHEVVFFQIVEGCYLTIRPDGCIYYFGKKIADSLEKFLKKMDEQTDYYLSGN